MSSGEAKEETWRQWDCFDVTDDLREWICGDEGLAKFIIGVLGWSDARKAAYDAKHNEGAYFELWFEKKKKAVEAMATLSGSIIKSWTEKPEVKEFCDLKKILDAYPALLAAVMELPGHPLNPSTCQGGGSTVLTKEDVTKIVEDNRRARRRSQNRGTFRKVNSSSLLTVTQFSKSLPHRKDDDSDFQYLKQTESKCIKWPSFQGTPGGSKLKLKDGEVSYNRKVASAITEVLKGTQHRVVDTQHAKNLFERSPDLCVCGTNLLVGDALGAPDGQDVVTLLEGYAVTWKNDNGHIQAGDIDTEHIGKIKLYARDILECQPARRLVRAVTFCQFHFRLWTVQLTGGSEVTIRASSRHLFNVDGCKLFSSILCQPPEFFGMVSHVPYMKGTERADIRVRGIGYGHSCNVYVSKEDPDLVLKVFKDEKSAEKEAKVLNELAGVFGFPQVKGRRNHVLGLNHCGVPLSEWSRCPMGKDVVGILTCLRALHKTGYVHCDVRPSNLLIKDEGKKGCTITLIDFATCVRLEDNVEQLVGTTHFASTRVLKFLTNPVGVFQVTAADDMVSLVRSWMLCRQKPYLFRELMSIDKRAFREIDAWWEGTLSEFGKWKALEACAIKGDPKDLEKMIEEWDSEPS